MEIKEYKDLLLSDTLIPDIFISQYLPLLKNPYSVKAYLYLLLTAHSGIRQATLEDMAARFGAESKDALDLALLELTEQGVIMVNKEQIILVDLKKRELEKNYKPKTISYDQEQRFKTTPSQREALMQDINDTFFQGVMSSIWYAKIETWFEQYHFAPEVMFALFKQCADRNKLDGPAYISVVAETWAKQNIINFNDLNLYTSKMDEVRKIAYKIGKKIHKNITDYDIEIVNKWLFEYHYTFKIIEIALKKLSGIGQPSLFYVDKILTEWYEQQLKTEEEIFNYETKNKKIKSKHQPKIEGNRGNFDQRTYDDEYLDSFIKNK